MKETDMIEAAPVTSAASLLPNLLGLPACCPEQGRSLVTVVLRIVAAPGMMFNVRASQNARSIHQEA